MHQSTLKQPFRLRCTQCRAFSAQSYNPARQSVMCHKCRIYIGTPACKVCHSEDTQAHQPKNGRWVCNDCGGTFTFRSLPTKAEKRRLQANRKHKRGTLLPCSQTSVTYHDDDAKEGGAISISSVPSTPECQIVAPNFSVCDRNDELLALISVVDQFANNRNIAFDFHGFQSRLERVVRGFDDERSKGTSSILLASVTEEALYACHIKELVQAVVRVATASRDMTNVLAKIMKFSSIRMALNSEDSEFLRAVDVALQEGPDASDEEDLSEDNESMQYDHVMHSEVNSESERVTSCTTNQVTGCHRPDAILGSNENQASYDVDWRWYPQRPTALLTCGFTVRLLNYNAQ